MKTKEVIRQLQEADPTGEEHVTVENVDIFYIESLPAYYDGAAQQLIRDESNPYYNVTGARFKRAGKKIQIVTHSIRYAIEQNPDLPIDYSELPSDRQQQVKEAHDGVRQNTRDIERQLSLGYFTDWLIEKATGLTEDLENVKEYAREFYDANITPNDPMPEDIIHLPLSWLDRRRAQWDREIKVFLDQGELEITKQVAT